MSIKLVQGCFKLFKFTYIMSKINIILTSFVAMAALLLLPGPALAAVPVYLAPTAPNSSTGPNTSLNWAGYAASGTNVTSVGATWTIPSITNPIASTADATWVGIGGVSSKDLIQAGTMAITDNSNQVSYEAWFEILPADSETVPLSVNPGDSVTVSLNETSQNQWTVSFRDNTTGQSYQTTVSYVSSNSSAEWIEEMPTGTSGFIPLDNFGSVAFSNAFAVSNGSPLTPQSMDASPITLLTGGNTALAIPSALGSDGASFTVTRTSAAVTNVSPNVRTMRIGRGWSRTGVGIQGFTAPSSTNPIRIVRQNNGGFQIFVRFFRFR